MHTFAHMAVDWLAFQIVDDVLDLTQTSEQLGKTAGKDAAAEKTPIGVVWNRRVAPQGGRLVDQACAQLDPFARARRH